VYPPERIKTITKQPDIDEELINDAAEILEFNVPLTNADISKIDAFNRKVTEAERFTFQSLLTASQKPLSASATGWDADDWKENKMQTKTEEKSITNQTNLVMSASLMAEAELNKKLGLDNNQKFLAKEVLDENLKNFADANKFKLVAVEELHETPVTRNITINNILNAIKVGLVFCFLTFAVFLIFRYFTNPDVRLGAVLTCFLVCIIYILANILKTPFKFFNEHFLYNHLKITGTFDVPRFLSYKIPMRIKQKMSDLLDAETFDKFIFHYHVLKGSVVPKDW
jgi:hypothetical protein